MSVIVEDIVNIVNDHIDDSSEDRITFDQRLRKISESVGWIQRELENDHQVKAVEFQYFDTVNRYKIRPATAKFLDANQLSLPLGDDFPQFTKRSARDMSRSLSDGTNERGYGIEWKNGIPTMLINFTPKRRALVVGSFDSLTADGGEWELSGDADNIREDRIEFSQGTGSIVFDIDHDTGTSGIFNTATTERDLQNYQNISTFLLDLTVNKEVSAVKLKWGTDASNHYEVEVTEDMFGDEFEVGRRMILAFDWDNPDSFGNPNPQQIKYYAVEITAGESQESVRVDHLRLLIPQTLELKYLSYVVGTNADGEDITEFTELEDVPYFSGQYDDMKVPVAHYASSLLFADMRLYDDQVNHQNFANDSLRKLGHLIPRSRSKEVKAFRPSGLNFSRRSRGRRF